MKIRFMEEESQFSKYEKNTMIRDVLNIVRIKTVTDAILIFELLLNKKELSRY